MGIAPDSILGQAVQVVTSKISELDAMGRQYGAQLSSALAKIAAVKVDEVAPPTPLEPIAAPIPQFNLGSAPAFSAPHLAQPTAPHAPSIDSLLAQLDVGDMDALPAAPALIALNLPDAPGMAEIAAPDRPAVDLNIAMPDAPALTMPTMEELQAITLPAFEFPALPDFDGRPPSFDAAVPNVFINWSEPAYHSELLDELTAEVRALMAGGTGLPPAIEDALFARTRERDSTEGVRAIQEAVDTWAARDFSMPPGMLVRQADIVREQNRLKAAETNRDILTQAAQWEIENLRFAVQQGMALEQLTQNLFSNTVNRLFEVARFQAESQINVFNAQIGLFNAQNQAFANTVQVFRTRLDAALAKLTAQKTAIDAAVAVGQLNVQKVEVFKARLEGVRASVDLFKAQMDGAKVRADVISSQFDAYKADVQAFAERVGAEKTKFDAYEAQVRGETSKAHMLDAQSRAYASTIQALSSKAEIKVKGAQLRMDAARVRLQEFMGNVDAYKAQLSAALNAVSYATQAYQSQVEGWKAGASASVAQSEVQSRFADMNVRTNIAYSEMQISAFQAKSQKAVQSANIALEAAKAVGQYSAQLAAGVMSAAHVTASIGGSGSATSSETKSTGTSTSYNYSY